MRFKKGEYVFILTKDDGQWGSEGPFEILSYDPRSGYHCRDADGRSLLVRSSDAFNDMGTAIAEVMARNFGGSA